MTHSFSAQRGISLIEALVALAVVAFGMLGVAGMQSSLRFNADVAKQRSEAVRLAASVIEDARGFTAVNVTPGKTAYGDIVEQAAAPVLTTNTTYTRRVTVADNVDQNRKSVRAVVTWPDRNGVTQSVALVTQIHRIEPTIGGALGVPVTGSAAQAPRGRHAHIPPGAISQPGTGTSDFSPPGANGWTWVFNDTTGEIRRACTPVCTEVLGYGLWGYVRYSVSTLPTPIAPTSQDAENPTSPVASMPAIGVTAANPLDPPTCFTAAFPTYVVYFCAVTVTPPATTWTGRTQITGLNLATSIADATAGRARVCRYTPARAHTGVKNIEHPLDYSNLAGSLGNQNFLIILAGDGTTPFDCPTDGPNVFHQQQYLAPPTGELSCAAACLCRRRLHRCPLARSISNASRKPCCWPKAQLA